LYKPLIYTEDSSGNSLIIKELKVRELDGKIQRLQYDTFTTLSNTSHLLPNNYVQSLDEIPTQVTVNFPIKNNNTYSLTCSFLLVSNITQNIIEIPYNISDINNQNIYFTNSNQTGISNILVGFIPYIFSLTGMVYLKESSNYKLVINIVTDTINVAVSNVDFKIISI
jgi:hypothetical protein